MAPSKGKTATKAIPNGGARSHEATSNIIFNLSQMGISLNDSRFIELDTYFELLDLYRKSNGGNSTREATQADIDRFLT